MWYNDISFLNPVCVKSASYRIMSATYLWNLWFFCCFGLFRTKKVLFFSDLQFGEIVGNSYSMMDRISKYLDVVYFERHTFPYVVNSLWVELRIIRVWTGTILYEEYIRPQSAVVLDRLMTKTLIRRHYHKIGKCRSRTGGNLTSYSIVLDSCQSPNVILSQTKWGKSSSPFLRYIDAHLREKTSPFGFVLK